MEKLSDLTIEELAAYLKVTESVCRKYENEAYLNKNKEIDFRRYGGIKEKIISEIEKRLAKLC